MAKTKKEDLEENSRIGSWANGLRIVCNILKVFDIIGIVCLALVLVFTPKMLREIKIDDERIIIFNQKIEYSFKDVDFLVYKIDNGKEKRINTKDVYKYLNLMDLGKTNMNKLRNVIMVDLVFAIILCVMEYWIINTLSILLKRTRDENVAFVSGGHQLLSNIVWVALAMEVVKIVMSVFTSIAIPASEKITANININLEFILGLCVVFFVSLLYKRGEELQNR